MVHNWTDLQLVDSSTLVQMVSNVQLCYRRGSLFRLDHKYSSDNLRYYAAKC
jgi:hypothetical protein